jgi:S-formylglutathione hydrolase FrmB
MKRIILFTIISFFLALQVGAQEQMVFKSKNLPQNDTVWVFKPQKSLGKALPLIFLLHGYSGNYKQWHSIMDAQKYADEYGFLIVCPDGLYKSWYLNSPIKADWQYETFFFKELYPDIIKKYPVDTGKVFITGLSMGGHGALHLFILRPDLFASAGSTSGGIRLTPELARYGMNDLLGDFASHSDNWKAASVYDNIDKIKVSNKPFIFDCGTSDFFYEANNLLKAKCDSLKLPATYITQPGAHNRAYWAKSIRQQFDYFKTFIQPNTKN